MEKILVAKISKPQGIKGEVKCQIFTDVLAVFNDITIFEIDGIKREIEKLCVRMGSLYIKFKDVNSRNEAENLRNKELFVEKSVLQENMQDEFLIDDLIGMVILDENNEQVGQIVDVENYGASDILTVLEDNHEFQIPFTQAVFKTDENNRLYVLRKEYNNNKI